MGGSPFFYGGDCCVRLCFWFSPAATLCVHSHKVKCMRTNSRPDMSLVAAPTLALSRTPSGVQVPESRLALGSPGRECQGDIIKIFQ